MRESSVDAVWVYPDFDPVYYGFYIEGLRRLLGPSKVKLATAPFSAAARLPNEDRMSVRLLAEAGGRARRITIESNDMLSFDPVSVEWAEVIAKVNYESAESPESVRSRVLPIGPSFAVTAWEGLDLTNWTATAVTSPMRSTSARRRVALVKMYAHQYAKRLPERSYSPLISDPDYLFFAAKGWLRYGYVNEPRARFYKVAGSQSGLQLEGGFVPESGGLPEELGQSVAPRRYSLREYLDRTARSVVVFNTPAVHGCLGWKLGEFLALGKAIISLPVRRELPAPLVHGEHIHYVGDDDREMEDALARIRKDHPYRARLERNARAYYDQWISPEAVASRILERSGFQ